MILHKTLQWQQQNTNQDIELTENNLYLAFTGELWSVRCEDVQNKNSRVIMAPHCISHLFVMIMASHWNTPMNLVVIFCSTCWLPVDFIKTNDGHLLIGPRENYFWYHKHDTCIFFRWFIYLTYRQPSTHACSKSHVWTANWRCVNVNIRTRFNALCLHIHWMNNQDGGFHDSGGKP